MPPFRSTGRACKRETYTPLAILLPSNCAEYNDDDDADTRVEDAVKAMTRVQRELTRKFFMANNDKVLITFSCGVADVTPAEDPYEALSRADAAMYMAKRSGKNMVIAA